MERKNIYIVILIITTIIATCCAIYFGLSLKEEKNEIAIERELMKSNTAKIEDLQTKLNIKEGDSSEIKEKILVEYNPQLSIIYINSESRDKIDDLIPFVKEYKNVYDTQTFYLCQNYTCLNPVNNLDDIVNNL